MKDTKTVRSCHLQKCLPCLRRLFGYLNRTITREEINVLQGNLNIKQVHKADVKM